LGLLLPNRSDYTIAARVVANVSMGFTLKKSRWRDATGLR